MNNEWKIRIESGRSVFTQLEIEEGRKYIKVWSYLNNTDERLNGRSVWMFIDKNMANVTNLLLQSTRKRCPLSDHSKWR